MVISSILGSILCFGSALSVRMGDVSPLTLQKSEAKLSFDEIIYRGGPFNGRIKDGVSMPEFSLVDLEGKAVSSTSLIRKPTFLFFFSTRSTWSGYSLPQIAELEKRYAAKGLEVVLVATGNTLAETQKFVADHPDWRFRVLHDDAPLDQSVAATKFRVPGFPTYFIVDAKGKIISSRTAPIWQISDPELHLNLAKAGLNTGDTYERLPDGTQAPDFSLLTSAGKPFQLSKLRGKVVFLTFWATWCPHCRDSKPTMARFVRDFKKKGVEFVSVCTTDSGENLKKYLASNPNFTTWTHLVDPSSEKASVGYSKFNISGFYTYYVINRGGKIVASHKQNLGDFTALEAVEGLARAGVELDR